MVALEAVVFVACVDVVFRRAVMVGTTEEDHQPAAVHA